MSEEKKEYNPYYKDYSWELFLLIIIFVTMSCNQCLMQLHTATQNEILERIELCIEDIQLPPQTQPNNQQ